MLPPHHVARKSVLDDILRQLREQCPSQRSVLPILALHGLGGLGKSTLAAELANCQAALQMFPDGVLWATLGQQPHIGALLNSWVRGVGERPTEAWSEASATAYLRTVLRERHVLMVIDDAWDEAHIRPFLVGGPACCVLLTTRRAATADGIGATLLSVPEMAPEESMNLLLRRTQRREPLSPADQHEAVLLTQQLGNLPLAIELVAALVARRYSWAEARHQLISFEDALPLNTHADSHARRKLDACLGLSLAVLRQESDEVWRAFGWFSLIPYEQQITAVITATLWDVPQERAERWLRVLEDDALIRYVGDGYKLHGLVHQMARHVFTAPLPHGQGMTMQQGHRELIRRYRATAVTGHWADIKNDGYIIDRWTWHLAEASDVDGLFELLGASTDDGGNRWYQRRNEAGRLAGYLDDLRLAREVAIKTRSRWRQIFVALCQSSVLSVTANYTEDVVYALVRRGMWSPAWAFRWAQDVCAPGLRVDCLLAVSSAVKVCSALGEIVDPQSTKVAREALRQALALMAHRPHTEAAKQSILRAVSAATTHDQPAAISAGLCWCESAREKDYFLGNLPDSVPAKAVEELLAGNHNHANLLDRFFLLARSARCSEEAKRLESAELLIDELPTTLTACDDNSRDALCDTLTATLPLLPTRLQDRAAEILLAYSAHTSVARVLEMLALIRDLPRRSTEDDGTTGFNFLNAEGKRKVAGEQLITHGNPELAMSIAHAVSRNGAEADSFLLWLGTLPTALQPMLVHDIASTLLRGNPESLFARLIVAPTTISGADLIRRIERATARSAAEIVTACVIFAPSLAETALKTFSKVKDQSEQARAVISIIPFLPPGADRGQFADLQNEEKAGKQIAGMTTLMLQLSDAIDADALSDVVEALSMQQSEWWVVEALSVTLMRIRVASELMAVVKSASRIRNLDLRARLQERAAVRLADLRFDALAIDVARAIELPSFRWAALHSLAVRFASTGNLDRAKDAAALVDSRDWAQKTWVDVAMELGALEMSAIARQLITQNVVDEEWKKYAVPVMASGTTGSSALATTRRYDRAIGEERLTRFELISASAENISEVLPLNTPIDAIIEAARSRNGLLLETCVADAWQSPRTNQPLLCDILSLMLRPHLLSVLAHIAPTLDICADQGDVVRITEAIHRVCRWWP